jgi:lipoprotein-releasing system permease protein
MLWFGLGLTVLSAVVLAVALWLGNRAQVPESFLPPRPPLFVENLRIAGISGLCAGLVITFLGVLLASFTVFTAISVFGVFLGTAAPVVALSVMSGFEADLKGKIRGAKADVVITRAGDEPFSEWDSVQKALRDVPGFVASTPFIESEVMLRSGDSFQGVTLRGIDPATAAAVIDFGKGEGSVEDLADPQRVLKAAQERWFRRVTTLRELRARPPGEEAPPADRPAPSGAAAPPAPTGAPETAKPGDAPGPAAPAEPAPEDAEAAEDRAGAAPQPMPTIILGDELYKRILRTFVGSEIEAICPQCGDGPAGPQPDMRPFRVAGHVYSGMYEFDSKLAYIALPEAQRFLNLRGEITGIDVRTANPDAAESFAAEAARRLGPAYEVRSWQELNRGLFMALRLEKIAMFIVLTFIALVASFSIVSNLIMLVTEKGKEVAMLKAMGARDGAVLRIFFAEGLYIGLLGLAAGLSTGVLACRLLERYGLPLPTDVYYISELPVVMRAGEILTVGALALLLCCLATIYPAVLASRMKPVDGLRYE